MNIHTAGQVVAFRNHLSLRIGAEETTDEERAVIGERMALLEAIAKQPQLAGVLLDIGAARKPGYVNLFSRLGSATTASGRIVCSDANPSPASAQWWTVSADEKTCFIRGEILGDAEMFIAQTQRVERICIDSVGGCTRTAMKIADAFKGRKVRTVVQGRACSAAFTLAMMGEPRIIARDAKLMAHSPRAVSFGTPAELVKDAEWLSGVIAELTAYYCARTGWSAATVSKWFDGGDHYFDAAQAVAMGLADEIYDAPPADEPVTAASMETPADPGNESLFMQWLSAFGPVTTRDRAKLFRELQVWSTFNIKTV